MQIAEGYSVDLSDDMHNVNESENFCPIALYAFGIKDKEDSDHSAYQNYGTLYK